MIKNIVFDIGNVIGYVLSYIEHQVKPYISIYKTLINRYDLKENECLYIDDNDNNIRTANELGMIGKYQDFARSHIEADMDI